jgi:hypothetical protein
LKQVFRRYVTGPQLRGIFFTRTHKVELEVFEISAAFETLTGFSFICDKAIEARSQKRLETRLRSIVAGEVVLLECSCEEALREIFGVFVTGVPLKANVFVNWFPVAGENLIERALPHNLVAAARLNDR